MTKQKYSHIFNLLDFADELINRIKPGELDNGNYFMTLVYIEDVLDTYGRGFVLTTARESGHSDNEASALMYTATARMDLLRQAINDLSQVYDFNDVLDGKAERFRRDWRRNN
jgi:hypothetical protein